MVSDWDMLRVPVMKFPTIPRNLFHLFWVRIGFIIDVFFRTKKLTLVTFSVQLLLLSPLLPPQILP